MTDVISINSERNMTVEEKLSKVVKVLKICGGYDVSTGEKAALIRETLRFLGESPSITPLIKSQASQTKPGLQTSP